jgi:hypothetical protein
MRKSGFLLLAAGVALGTAAIGLACGGGDSCPGLVCSDCSGSGDCNISCTAPEVQYCGNFGLSTDPTYRCTYCGPP